MGLLRPRKKLVNSATNTMTTEELLAPLASMEDLSVLMTPMSTPGPSPRTRARWSHRSSSGSQYEPYVPSPLTSNTTPLPPPPAVPRKGPAGSSLLRQSLENGHQIPNRFVTPYKHDPQLMNADLQQQVIFRREPMRERNFHRGRTYPSIDEAEEFLLEPEHVNNTQVTSAIVKGSSASSKCENKSAGNSERQVQFLTPRRHNHHVNCAFNDLELSKRSIDFHEDRVRNRPEPKDR